MAGPLILIPARGGSKRLPRKNVAVIGEIPGFGPMTLVETAIKAGRDSKLGKVMVSTDIVEVSQIAGHWQAALHWRSDDLRGDDVESIELVRRVIEHEVECDAVILLQPTSPLRTVDDVLRAWELHQRNQGDAVVSVAEARHQKDFLYTVGVAHRMRPYSEARGIYVPNGAIYILSRAAIEAGQDWWSGITYAYIMPPERSIDIDTQADLDRAREMYVEQNPGYRHYRSVGASWPKAEDDPRSVY